MGLASLLRPARPLPTCRSRVPLRRNPNSDAAIIAARLARGHGTSLPHLAGDETHRGDRTHEACSSSGSALSMFPATHAAVGGGGAQHALVRRLQGRIRARQWPLLLPARGDKPAPSRRVQARQCCLSYVLSAMSPGRTQVGQDLFGAGEGIRTLDPNLGKVRVVHFLLLTRDHRRLLLVAA